MKCIPTFRFSHVRDVKERESVSLDVFERQISHLQRKSYTFLTLEDVINFKRNPALLPKKCVLLTFDGAWRDIYDNAYGILKHYWAKAALFVVTEWVDEASKHESNYLEMPHSECKNALIDNPRSVVCSWNELKKMQDVFSIGSMTHTYQFSNILQIPWHEDFELSKKLIKTILNVDTRHLAWPNGNYDKGLLRTAKSIGYEAFYTMDSGINALDSDNEALKRLQVKDDFAWFKKALFITSNTRFFKFGKIFL